MPLRIISKPKKIMISSSTGIIKVVIGVNQPYSRASFRKKQQYTCALNVSNILDEIFYSALLEYLKAQWMLENKDLGQFE